MEVVVVAAGFREISGDFFGPGAPWLADRLPDLVGADDDASGFRPPKPMLQTWRRHAGLRTPRTQVVFETLVPVVLAQKVTGLEAAQGYRRLLRRYGEPIGEGPFPALLVPPPARVWTQVPSWEWHRAGVGPERARTVIAAARRAAALERLTQLAPDVAREKLQVVPGLGPWTAAEVAQRCWGDADAFSWGDYHAAKDVVYALTARRDGSDEEARELMADQVGHRFRVQRLVEVGRLGQPRRGPRYTGLDHRRR